MNLETLTASVNTHLDAMADEIETALKAEAERLMQAYPHIKLIFWCMGTAQVAVDEIEVWDEEEVTVKTSFPDFGGRATPAYLSNFFAIAALDDRLYSVLTGRPRRYERLATGEVEFTTEW